MKIVSLASGSKGNAYLVLTDGDALLVDCGLAYRTLLSRIKAALPGESGVLKRLRGILVTHTHTDHTSGLPTLVKHVDCPIYANAMTAEAIQVQGGLGDECFVCFENAQDFEVGPFAVRAFSIPHDTADPVGYLVSAGGETYFHGTDIGTPLDSIGVKLAEAHVATLESNHDAVMLRQSGRPPSLIQRIAGPRGHLSNDQAADLVRRFATPRLRRLALAHLSQDCNAPHLAEREMRQALQSAGRGDVALSVLSQDDVLAY